MARNLSGYHAIAQCRPAMEATGLEWYHARDACQRAADEDNDD